MILTFRVVGIATLCQVRVLRFDIPKGCVPLACLTYTEPVHALLVGLVKAELPCGCIAGFPELRQAVVAVGLRFASEVVDARDLPTATLADVVKANHAIATNSASMAEFNHWGKQFFKLLITINNNKFHHAFLEEFICV